MEDILPLDANFLFNLENPSVQLHSVPNCQKNRQKGRTSVGSCPTITVGPIYLRQGGLSYQKSLWVKDESANP